MAGWAFWGGEAEKMKTRNVLLAFGVGALLVAVGQQVAGKSQWDRAKLAVKEAREKFQSRDSTGPEPLQAGETEREALFI